MKVRNTTDIKKQVKVRNTDSISQQNPAAWQWRDAR